MRGRVSIMVFLYLLMSCVSALAEDDGVKKKLDAAKVNYETEMERFRNSVDDWFDKREETARKAGNKQQVDQIKAEKQSLEKRGELPKSLPAATKQKATAAKLALEAAYGAAVKGYTREKMDDEAAAVEKELKEFQAGAAPTAAASETRFFNGKDLTGWKGMRGLWNVKDGTIVGATPPEGIAFNSCLCSAQQYGDFELTCQVKLIGTTTANSGIQIRSEIIDPEKFICRGPQCDIGQAYWGSLYNEGGAMLHEADKALVTRALKANDFNELFVRCAGNRVLIKLNGQTTVDRVIPNLPQRGIIGWQLHSGKGFGLVVKDIEFKEISALK